MPRFLVFPLFSVWDSHLGPSRSWERVNCTLFTIMPCYVALAPCYSMFYFHALLFCALFSCLTTLFLHLAFTPYCFTFAPCSWALLLCSCTLFLCLITLFLHLATIYYCVLLLSHLVAIAITPCYLCLLPYCRCLTIVPCCSPFLGTFCPSPLLFRCLIAHFCTLLFCLVNWYSFFTLLCKWTSLEQHQ